MQLGISHKQVQSISNYIEELNRLDLCISFWESRIVHGWTAPFFLAHNLHCVFKADGYYRQRDALNLKLTSKLRLVK